MQQRNQQHKHQDDEMTDDEVAISMVGFIILFLFFIITLLYGGPLLDWLDSL